MPRMIDADKTTTADEQRKPVVGHCPKCGGIAVYLDGFIDAHELLVWLKAVKENTALFIGVADVSNEYPNGQLDAYDNVIAYVRKKAGVE